MKKILKIGLILVIILAILVSLFMVYKRNRIVAIKVTDGLETKVEFKFKDDKVSQVKSTVEMSTEEEARETVKMFELSVLEIGEIAKGLKAEQDKNNVIIMMDGETFKNMDQLSDEQITKVAIQKSLEESGYRIKIK